MSKDDKGAFGGRLWSGSDKDRRDPERQPEQSRTTEQQRRAADSGAEPDDFLIHPMHPDRVYQAFRMARRPERLHIDRAIKPSRFLAYHYLVDMNYDPALETAFTLFYTSATVEVTGDHLWPVVYALWHGKCESIHAYHPQFYDRPAKNIPFIDAITVKPPTVPME